jgi:hypothetical protein
MFHVEPGSLQLSNPTPPIPIYPLRREFDDDTRRNPSETPLGSWGIRLLAGFICLAGTVSPTAIF